MNTASKVRIYWAIVRLISRAAWAYLPMRVVLVLGALGWAVLMLSGCSPSYGPGVEMPRRNCGAVAVARGVLLTAAHCAKNDPNLIVADESRDLALVRGESEVAAEVRRGVEGEAVAACSPIHRVCVGGRLLREGVGHWEADLNISAGWSGSPVIGLDGALIGVVVACQGTTQWAGLYQIKKCKAGFAIVAEIIQ